jgi:hypothetical protein
LLDAVIAVGRFERSSSNRKVHRPIDPPVSWPVEISLEKLLVSVVILRTEHRHQLGRPFVAGRGKHRRGLAQGERMFAGHAFRVADEVGDP